MQLLILQRGELRKNKSKKVKSVDMRKGKWITTKFTKLQSKFPIKLE